MTVMSLLSFKFAPAPFESPSFESLFSETLLTTRPLRHDNANSTTRSNSSHTESISPSGSGISTSTFGSDRGFLNFRIHSPPPSLTPVLGSLEYDLAKERYTH